MHLGTRSPAARARFAGPADRPAHLLPGFVLPVSLPRIHQTLKPLQAHLIALGIDAVIPTQCPRFFAVPTLASIHHLSLPSSAFFAPAQSLSVRGLPKLEGAFFRDRSGKVRPDSTETTLIPGSSGVVPRGEPVPLLFAFRTSCTPGKYIDLCGAPLPAGASIWLSDKMGLSVSYGATKQEQLSPLPSLGG